MGYPESSACAPQPPDSYFLLSHALLTPQHPPPSPFPPPLPRFRSSNAERRDDRKTIKSGFINRARANRKHEETGEIPLLHPAIYLYISFLALRVSGGGVTSSSSGHIHESNNNHPSSIKVNLEQPNHTEGPLGLWDETPPEPGNRTLNPPYSLSLSLNSSGDFLSFAFSVFTPAVWPGTGGFRNMEPS